MVVRKRPFVVMEIIQSVVSPATAGKVTSHLLKLSSVEDVPFPAMNRRDILKHLSAAPFFTMFINERKAWLGSTIAPPRRPRP
jgi:hypothetical protein